MRAREYFASQSKAEILQLYGAELELITWSAQTTNNSPYLQGTYFHDANESRDNVKPTYARTIQCHFMTASS